MIDCILFNDELDLLISRLRYLNSFVDEFVVIEADKTFSGRPKELIATNHLSLLQEASLNRITILRADFSALKVTSAWDYENESRLQLLNYVLREAPDQRVLFCDIDEFPSHEQLTILKGYENSLSEEVFSIPTPTYYRYVNLANLDEVDFRSSISFHVSSAPKVVEIRKTQFRVIEGEPGAHLSYLSMSASLMSGKLDSFSHTEFQGFEPIEHGLLEISDRYVLDHLGRFHHPSRGLMKVINPQELPQVNRDIQAIMGAPIIHTATPWKFSRLCASALVTFIRAKRDENSFLYRHVIEKVSSGNITKLSDIGCFLSLIVTILESLEGNGNRIWTRILPCRLR